MTNFDFVTRLPQTISCKRLILRRPLESDAATIARLGNNPKIHAMVSVVPSPYTEDMALEFVKEKTRTQSDHVFALTTRDDDLIGIIALHDRPKGIEIGYWLGEPYWGEGYASEAVACVTKAALEAGANGLWARAMAHNTASRRVLEKAGYTQVEEFREDCGPHPEVLQCLYRHGRPE